MYLKIKIKKQKMELDKKLSKPIYGIEENV